MPTTRRRIWVPITPEVESALALAAWRRPGEPPAKPLRGTIAAGAAALKVEEEHLSQSVNPD